MHIINVKLILVCTFNWFFILFKWMFYRNYYWKW